MKLVGSQKKGYKLVSSFVEKPKKNNFNGNNTPPNNGGTNTPPAIDDGKNDTE